MNMRRNADLLAQGLGWFSIGLGIAELLAPRRIAPRIGLSGQEQLIRLYGMREIATGVGLLAVRDRRRAPWLWGRVAGDVVDIFTLAGAAQRALPWRRDARGLAMAAVLGVTALDVLAAGVLSRRPGQRGGGQGPVRDYRTRTGFPRPPAQMRGAARDFEVPRDMRAPEALRSWPA